MSPEPIEPTREQMTELAAVAGGPDDGPVVMLNLNRYRERAAYEADPPAGGSRDVSGREAYERYGEVARVILDRVGAKILWHAHTEGSVVGDDATEFDEVIAVWYPTLSAFIALATAPEVLIARADRMAGLERAAIIRCASGPDPVLPAV